MKAAVQCAKSNEAGAGTASRPFFAKSAENSFFPDTQQASSFFSPPVIQPKLIIGKPNDVYEQEADTMASQMVQRLHTNEAVQTKALTHAGKPLIQKKCAACAHQEQVQRKAQRQCSPVKLLQKQSLPGAKQLHAKPSIQRKCTACEEQEKLQRKEESNSAPAPTSSLENRLRATKGGGHALPAHTRQGMESSFGADFSGVRVHTNSTAVQLSQDLQAQAFTHGNDIYFNAGKYNPATTTGQHLLAHELTHTIQQGASPATPGVQADFFDDLGDAYDSAIDTVSSAGEAAYEAGANAVDTVSQAGSDAVDWAAETGGQVVDTVSQAGSDAVDWATETGSAAVDTVTQAGSDALDWAKETGGQVVDTVTQAGNEAWNWAKDTGGDIRDAGGEALDWIATQAGQAALATAQSLAGLFNGTVTVVGTEIIVTIPNVSLFSSFQEEVGEELPAMPLFIMPIFAAPLGPIDFAATLEAHATPSLLAAIGPGELRDIRVSLDPFAGTFAGHAQLYVAAALGSRLSLFGGIVGRGIGVIPFDPPIPMEASLEGGLRGTGTAWDIGAISSMLDVTYSGGTWGFTANNDLKLGLLLQGDVDLYAAAKMFEFLVCEYAYPLGHWETGEAWNINIPVGLGGGAPPSVGPVTTGSIPVDSIETAIEPLAYGLKCKGLREIIEELCKEKKIPEDICEVILEADLEDDEGGGLLDIDPLSTRPCDELPDKYQYNSYNAAEQELKRRLGLPSSTRLYRNEKRATSGPCVRIGRHYNVWDTPSRKGQPVGAIGMCPCTITDRAGNEIKVERFAVLNPSSSLAIVGGDKVEPVIPTPLPDDPPGEDPPDIGPLAKSAPTGKTKDDPIEMIWFKPKNLYPAQIELTFDPDNDPKPWEVYKMSKRKKLPAKGDKGTEAIGGVSIPGKEPMQRVKTKDKGNKERFREDLSEFGFEWNEDVEFQADHVRDLAFKGEDSDKNLWPLEKSINEQAGTCHAWQQPEHSDPGDPPGTVRKNRPINQLEGRWFKIKEVKPPNDSCT